MSGAPTVADLFTALHRDGEHVAICHNGAGQFRADVVPVGAAALLAVAEHLPHGDVWHGVNPIRPDVEGRGTADDVTRLAALWADLDVKPGAMPSGEAARAVIADLAAMLGTSPAYVVSTGHGLHPYWLLDDDERLQLDTAAKRAAARAILARWRRLVTRVAVAHGGGVDAVFDLPRVLRTPGTWNRKDAEPLPVTLEAEGGWPLDVAAILEALDAYGVPELEADTLTLGPPVAPRDGWPTAGTTCGYTARMIAGWATDPVTGGRHHWAYGQHVRLACAARLGCVTPADYRRGLVALQARLDVLRAGDGPRPGEVAANDRDALALAERKSEDQARAELGDHAHREPLTEYATDPPPYTQEQPLAHGNNSEPAAGPRFLFTDGGAFLFDVPDATPAIWGDGDEVLWAEGEALIIAGPSGVGKTTLAGQIIRGRAGLQPDVLGYSVKPTGSRVLVLAMDRPQQARRALARTFRGDDRAVVADLFRFWKGPPPADLARHPEILAELTQEAGADTVIVDSLKDAAIGLSEDDVGASYNRARQAALAAGVQVLELHHTVKRGPNGARPNKLEDLYGSVWLTAGAGSVILLWGSPGDPIVDFHHLKQPAEPVGPFRVIHDHGAGVSSVWHATDALTVVRLAGAAGVTAQKLAAAIFETDEPDRNEIEKARRKLEALARAELAEKIDTPDPRGGPARTAYRAMHALTHALTHVSAGNALTDADSTHAPSVSAGQTLTDARTARTVPSTHAPSPLFTGGERVPTADQDEREGPDYCRECGQTDGHTKRCATRKRESA